MGFLLANRRNNLLLDNRLTRGRDRLHIIRILIIHGRLRHHGGNGRRLGKRSVILNLLIVFLLNGGGLLNHGGIQTLEGKVTHLLLELVDSDLLRAPRQAKLGTREPHTTTFHNRGNLGVLDQKVLHRDALVRSAVEIIELGVPLSFGTEAARQLNLEDRRVGVDVAILVRAILDARGVECLDHISAEIGLEPLLAVLDALVDHVLVHLLQDVHELLDIGALVRTTKGDIDRVLIGSLRILEGVETERKVHIHRSLHDETTAVVVQISLLGAALEHARGSNGDVLRLESGRVYDARHYGLDKRSV